MNRRLADRYEMVERVGSGGMAEVWRGIDHNLGRNVAIKLLHGHLAAEPNVLARFRSEAQAAARLTHPGIVGIYDTVTTNDTDAIIMELVSGRDLRTILDERPRLAVVDAVEVGVQLAGALGHAHQNGIIHRDVKPANILVRPDRRVKLSDFGIAKALDQTSHTESGSLVGTVKYLAPEQIEGHPVDGRTDLYGLTTVLYEMLCGQVPFPANDLMGAMKRLRKDPPSARAIRPDIPPALDAFLQKGLARVPAERYPDAATWSAALSASMRGEEHAVPDAEQRAPILVDPTIVDEAPASIPMRPAPARPSAQARGPIPSAGPGPSGSRPVTPRRAKKPKPPPIPSPAKHVKTKKRMSWLGPLIALGLMIAAIATVWFLLNPSNNDQINTDGEPGADSAESTDADDTDVDDGDVITDDGDSPDTTAVTGDAADDGEAGPTDDSVAETTTSTSTTTSTTTTTLPEFVNGQRSAAFDPLGDNAEHDEAVSLPFDGDPTTFWLTEKYVTRDLGRIKEGVGLLVEFEEARSMQDLRILSDRVGWSARLYEADTAGASLEAWDEAIAEFSDLGVDETLDVPDITVTAIMLWITDLGLAPEQTIEEYEAQVENDEREQQLKIFELELVG